MNDNINDLSERERRQNMLIHRVNGYADYPLTPEKVQDEVLFLKEIYGGGFRHDYSAFFNVVEKIYSDNKSKSSDFLQLNLDLIKTKAYELYNNEKDENICKSISKLYDHINLEILRFNSNSVMQSRLENVQKQLEVAQKLSEEEGQQLKAAKEQLEESKQKISHMQGESIAVISIFVAIVLAFTGGISYISSAVSALSTAPFYKTVTIVLVCGIIVFNTIYALLYVISRMLDKNIESKSCRQCKAQENVKCKIRVTKFLKRYPLFVIVNVFLILLLIYPFIMCCIYN